MKNFKLILTAIMLFVAITACRKTPEACIDADKTIAKVNETITVTSCSKDANAYIWGFKDMTGYVTTVSGGTICDDSWAFKTDSIGTYTVQLTACNYKKKCNTSSSNTGKQDETTLTITIIP
jgi:hypothetical protein